MTATAAAKIAEPAETPAMKAVLCVLLCGTSMEETAKAVGRLEPEAVEIPDGAIIVMTVGCKVTVKMLRLEGENEDEDEDVVRDAIEALRDVP